MVFTSHLFTAAFAFVGESSSPSWRASSFTTKPMMGRRTYTNTTPSILPQFFARDQLKMFMTTTASDPNHSRNVCSFEELYKSFGGSDDLIGLVRLESSSADDGNRGIYLNQDVLEGGIIIKVPLHYCVRHDTPPEWFDEFEVDPDADGDGDASSSSSNFADEEDNPHHYNPSAWATRLAASLIDMKLKSDSSLSTSAEMKNWLSLMPDEEYLRASLPIHWPDDILCNSKCTALEIATDAAYFARAEAVADLTVALQAPSIASSVEDHGYDVQRLISNALDLVQTRSCRVERLDGVQLCPPLRVVAPVFDFINHGSSRYGGQGSSNAYFGLEIHNDEQVLVVRARRDIKADQEVLIDYGDSARPAWRCLSSYGFVPNYRVSSDEYFEGEDECVAEVYFNGKRYEVSTDTIPTELVEAAQASYLEEEEGIRAFSKLEERDGRDKEEESNSLLTPEVALRLSKRLSEAAFELMISHHPEEEARNGTQNDEHEEVSVKLAKDLQKLLRWSQHKVLLTCAIGLRDYAARSLNLP